MIRSKLPEVKLAKERELGRKLTYKEIRESSTIADSTLSRLMSVNPVDRIDGSTLNGLCQFFNCGVGDLLEYVPE
jgi:DNA-binding Xre family transcriptional regulator